MGLSFSNLKFVLRSFAFGLQVLLYSFALTNAANASNAAAKWYGQAEMEGILGNVYSVARYKGIMPMMQSNRDLLMADARVSMYSEGDLNGDGVQSVSLGAIYRTMTSGCALGVFTYIDQFFPQYSHADENTSARSYSQIVGGLQMMSDYIDVQLTAYLPQHVNSSLSAFYRSEGAGNAATYYRDSLVEQTAYGFEAEIGAHGEASDMVSIGGYVGAYRFNLPDNSEFYGPKARIEARAETFAGGHLYGSFSFQHDDQRGSQYFMSIKASADLGPAANRKKYSALERRMNEPIRRDDILNMIIKEKIQEISLGEFIAGASSGNSNANIVTLSEGDPQAQIDAAGPGAIILVPTNITISGGAPLTLGTGQILYGTGPGSINYTFSTLSTDTLSSSFNPGVPTISNDSPDQIVLMFSDHSRAYNLNIDGRAQTVYPLVVGRDDGVVIEDVGLGNITVVSGSSMADESVLFVYKAKDVVMQDITVVAPRASGELFGVQDASNINVSNIKIQYVASDGLFNASLDAITIIDSSNVNISGVSLIGDPAVDNVGDAIASIGNATTANSNININDVSLNNWKSDQVFFVRDSVNTSLSGVSFTGNVQPGRIFQLGSRNSSSSIANENITISNINVTSMDTIGEFVGATKGVELSNITMDNVAADTDAAMITIGYSRGTSQTTGDFDGVFSNITINTADSTSDSRTFVRIDSVDAGNPLKVKNLALERITTVNTPILVDVSNTHPDGVIENLTINAASVSGFAAPAAPAASYAGLVLLSDSGSTVENVTISNSSIVGGGAPVAYTNPYYALISNKETAGNTVKLGNVVIENNFIDNVSSVVQTLGGSTTGGTIESVVIRGNELNRIGGKPADTDTNDVITSGIVTTSNDTIYGNVEIDGNSYGGGFATAHFVANGANATTGTGTWDSIKVTETIYKDGLPAVLLNKTGAITIDTLEVGGDVARALVLWEVDSANTIVSHYNLNTTSPASDAQEKSTIFVQGPSASPTEFSILDIKTTGTTTDVGGIDVSNAANSIIAVSGTGSSLPVFQSVDLINNTSCINMTNVKDASGETYTGNYTDGAPDDTCTN